MVCLNLYHIVLHYPIYCRVCGWFIVVGFILFCKQNSRDDTLIIDKLLIENATTFTDLAKKQKLARTP